MTIDYIIVGQGISGTFLSWELMKRGKRVLVIDEPKNNSASKVASGVINPVTGRRVVRTWEIETLMPYAVEAYTRFGEELGTGLIRQCNILDFHATPQMKMAFAERLHEEPFLSTPTNENDYYQWFHPAFGVTEINPCWLIQLHSLLNSWRNELRKKDYLVEENFDITNCSIQPEKIIYKDIIAQKIIFCDGTVGFDNPYFKLLPYARNKGQALIAAIPDLPTTHIFKQGINIVPWQDGLFWIGSSYEWDFTTLAPSTDFQEKVVSQLKQWLKLPFTVVDHIAGERPANMERRPFVGFHPIMPSVGILNGMGTKGCSLAPYFAHQLTQYLVEGATIHPQADVQRFRKILSR
ncbi:MAG: FAD-binding oxidoreductase [Chitinophagaceae bacterium]|nr:FAD-binding oxidoreductase [Chitinophagaceae bacterium]